MIMNMIRMNPNPTNNVKDQHLPYRSQTHKNKENHPNVELKLLIKVNCWFTQNCGHSEPAPTSAAWRMDGKWSSNSFLLCSSSLLNYGG
jgi:hypothetical protein